MVQDWPRDSFPRHQSLSHTCFSQEQQTERHTSFAADRYSHGMQAQNGFHQDRYQGSNQNSRFGDVNDPARRHPQMDIDDALRRQLGVPVRRYFVAAAADDGTPSTFVSGGHKLPGNVIAQFFDAGKFQQVMGRLEAGKPLICCAPKMTTNLFLGADPMLDDSFNQDEPVFNRHIFNRSRPGDRRRSSALADWGSPARSGRKRPRPRNPLNDDEDTQMTVSSRRGIRVGDSDAVWAFYEQRFKNCQQTACKLIAKAWVKAVEPKKQSTHPYTGSDEKAPDWWPKPWGPTKDDKVRHKEPDHLYKRERVHLLAHILRIVLEPNGKQHPDIRKLGLNVTKLEETTAEALSSFFMDNDANARKKPFLTEIFKVARQEERYKLGEIDGSTEIYVMSEDKVPDNYVSENDDAGSYIKEDEDVEPAAKPTTTLGGAMRPSVRTDATTLSGLPGTGDAFIGDLPMRGSQFQPPMMNEIAPQHNYVDNGPMQVHGQAGVSATSNLTIDLVPSPHDVSRRPSVFSDFPSPGSTMYSQQWQASSNGTNGSPMYAYAAQPPNIEAGPFVSPGVPMDPSQSFMTTSFEDAPRPGYTASQQGMFRQDEMSQSNVAQTTSYNYVTNDGRGLMSQVVENGSRATLH
ncbi:kinesin, putative [Cordyceps militaris CM01]|uniref:Kinesin, putative n=1 Tax=Cordyceps militaris (strain CM01) TaxID=983644 RepID=G3JQT7_CORMM|nr:kinesin, putative [Cordyceps militaris CM01]EGX89113.1 kinesin, putative [Cordyceps militaris CM01]